MILVGETNDAARELPFFLPSRSNPINGVTGYSFTSGQALLVLPGDDVDDAIAIDVSRIVERVGGSGEGEGLYAVQLTDSQVASRGKITLIVDVGMDAQPWTSWDDIMDLDLGISPILLGETDGAKAEIMFRLPSNADPLIGTTGAVLADFAGALLVRLPGATEWTTIDGDTGTLVEKGGGVYAIQPKAPILSALTIGPIYVDATLAGSQRYRGNEFIVRTFGGMLLAPIISNLTPIEGIATGGPGEFSASYSTARFTPIEFDLTRITPGVGITISAKFTNRDEKYVALDHDGAWSWPFDVYCTIGDLSVEPVHVSLLPRDGWPPVAVDIKVAAVKPAVEP